MTNLSIKRSISTMIFCLALGIGIGIFAFFLIYKGNLGGWFLGFIAIVILLAGILGLRDSAPRIIITDSGITVRALGPEEIPWQSVKSARVEFLVKVGATIILELTNGKKHRIYAEAMEMSASKILKTIEERIPDEPTG